MSIKDVARAAGVSLGTASNVLNRPGAVSPALRERVEAAIADLGFVRNESARQLRAGSSRTIAVVVLDVANPFFTDVVAGVEDAADALDALVVVASSSGSPERERRHLAHLEQQRVMGVLLTPVGDEAGAPITSLRRRGIPLVLLDRVAADPTLPSVAVDDLRGGEVAGEHLAARGHRRVAFVGGPSGLAQVRDRLDGLRRAAGGALAVEVVATAEASVRAGSRAAAEVLAGGPDERPTAVFCANDLLALGVLHECVRRGVRVPDDLAIVGYDDIDLAATAAVPLTSVRQPRDQLGRRGVELLTGSGRADGRVLFVPDLVERASTETSRGT